MRSQRRAYTLQDSDFPNLYLQLQFGPGQYDIRGTHIDQVVKTRDKAAEILAGWYRAKAHSPERFTITRTVDPYNQIATYSCPVCTTVYGAYSNICPVCGNLNWQFYP